MRRFPRWLTWVIGAAASACTVYGIPAYPAAAVFGASAVGATALKRSTTGGCWAVCSNGMHCDQDSGLCVENQERSARAETDAASSEGTAPVAQDAGSAAPSSEATDASDASFGADGSSVSDAGP